MAAKSKSEESRNKLEQRTKNANEQEQFAFKIIDIFMVILSIGTFLVDLSTDVVLVVNYFRYGHLYWAAGTLVLVVVPALVVQVFSMRWHIADENAKLSHWVTHVLLLGILHRQVLVLKTGLEARSSGDPTDFQRLYHQQNDICMLHLFESFLESAPQLVLQLYIMVSLEDWRSLTGNRDATSKPFCSINIFKRGRSSIT
ncbi:XK-related protein 4-like [Bacillus rossius redtenbacheri]|uniref:XK-related protein 4-like n=1 Tax=Bacillus rossius redtenbacheri TaxID=93214 RepID=UPI002FDE7CAA